jgi:PAS domain S-box-containing protein
MLGDPSGPPSAAWTFLTTLSDELRPLRDPREIQDVAARLLGEQLGVNRVSYAEVDGDEFVVGRSYARGVAPFTGRGPISLFGATFLDQYRRGETVTVDDVASDPRFSDAERASLLANQIAAFVGVMLHKDGRWVAAFGVHSATPRAWTREHVKLIEATGERTWAAADRAKAQDALRVSEERLAFLLRLNDALRPLSDPAEVQRVAVRLLGEFLHANRVNYAEIREDRFYLRQWYATGVEPLDRTGPVDLFGAGPVAALRNGKAVVVHDVRSDRMIADHERAALLAADIAAFTGVPLVTNRKWVGIIGVQSASPRNWTQAEIDLIRDVAGRTWEAVERARTEVALREREQRLRMVLEASAGGSWTWDAVVNHLEWDEGFRARYGFAADEPPAVETWVARLHEDDRARVLSLLEEIQRSKTLDAWDNTFRIITPDGSLRWIQSRGRADRDRHGQLTRLTGLELDITERRQAEEILQARREQERDRALRTLLETTTQGIVSIDAKGRIVTANRALEMMFGWTSGELIDQPLERLVPLPFRDRHGEHRARYFAAPKAQLMAGGLQLVGLRKDGSTFPIEVSLNHVATAAGERAFAFVTDITERQRAASALRERTIELEHRTAQLSQMASDLTLAEQHAREQIAKTLHDGLQQLLVIASLSLDQEVKRNQDRRIAPSVPLAQAKAHIDEAIDAARSLSVELFPPVLQHADLPVALRWLGDWTRTKYGLEVQIAADPRATSDRKDIRTLLFESVRELLFNVVKHAKVDRVTLDLALDPGGQVSITLTDEGIGFDASALFDRSKSGKTGWGLFSIRERLAQLGGRFEIHSEPGRGTQFRLLAPRTSAPAPGVTVDPVNVDAPGPRSPQAARTSTRPLRILVVDDHAGVRDVFRELLKQRPELDVAGEAADGVEAVAQAHALRPDVILMDITMPRMDGIEATRRLRAELPTIQILGLSMQPHAHGLHEIEHAGAAGFFIKGIDTERLIRHLLSVHETQQRSALT